MNKVIILLTIIFLIGLSLFSLHEISEFKKNNTVDYGEIYGVEELPLTVDQLPLIYQIEEVDGKKVLKVSYTNNTSEEIFNFSVELKVKDTQEPIRVNISQPLNRGETSSISQVDVSDDIKVEEIVAIKYMISLKRGMYIEYDAATNQYNWS